jgi:hypothetical protein
VIAAAALLVALLAARWAYRTAGALEALLDDARAGEGVTDEAAAGWRGLLR